MNNLYTLGFIIYTPLVAAAAQATDDDDDDDDDDDGDDDDDDDGDDEEPHGRRRRAKKKKKRKKKKKKEKKKKKKDGGDARQLAIALTARRRSDCKTVSSACFGSQRSIEQKGTRAPERLPTAPLLAFALLAHAGPRIRIPIASSPRCHADEARHSTTTRDR